MKASTRYAILICLSMLMTVSISPSKVKANVKSTMTKHSSELSNKKSLPADSKVFVTICSLKQGQLVELKQQPIFRGYELGTEYTIIFGNNCPNEECDESDPADPCKRSNGFRCEACHHWRCICHTKPCDNVIF